MSVITNRSNLWLSNQIKIWKNLMNKICDFWYFGLGNSPRTLFWHYKSLPQIWTAWHQCLYWIHPKGKTIEKTNESVFQKRCYGRTGGELYRAEFIGHSETSHWAKTRNLVTLILQLHLFCKQEVKYKYIVLQFCHLSMVSG